jgi:hypothetical protein
VSASIAASVIVIVFIIDSLALGDHAVKQAGLTDVPNVGDIAIGARTSRSHG